MLFPRPSTEMARGEDGRGAAHSRKLYRFLYTRFCAVIAWTLLQAPRSPKNLGQYNQRARSSVRELLLAAFVPDTVTSGTVR